MNIIPGALTCASFPRRLGFLFKKKNMNKKHLVVTCTSTSFCGSYVSRQDFFREEPRFLKRELALKLKNCTRALGL